ncbi:hypothetical protein ACMU_16590 [Actibacterium mucosum KCTC 23349]|uniref:HTH hxlR-type domain-containing protein n=1 Tax=Actibacterium mucosum KCTC 23349 TaxID=1454373 RepID=A0A037ZF20_9RHOB|nr:helix-turn-helix domain-containing protein [Actibacterium mucosum]KAJ54732.1 hypothetical protein ACMU_16590 [Actibacterium mucosum KCTC 23349]
MAKTRSYNLLCPIARALDAVGDRWSLLILRDLHAGPARFADLQSGLTGIASNLLSDRLVHLAAEGFLEKGPGPHGTTLYQLTDVGWSTRQLLFELARLGGQLMPVAKPKKPGNLRTIAVTLAAALERAGAGDTPLTATLEVEGEAFAIETGNGTVSVTAGAALGNDLRLVSSYDALLQVSVGAISLHAFSERFASLSGGTENSQSALMQALAGAMAQIQ